MADQEVLDLITVAVSEYVQNTDTAVVTLPEFIVLRLHDRGFRIANAERIAKNSRIASVAGDMWNELENLREHWQGTEREGFIQHWIDAYEKEAM